MIVFTMHNTDAVQFATEVQKRLNTNCLSITIIRQGLSEACCVHIATDGLSEDIVETLGQIYYEELMST